MGTLLNAKCKCGYLNKKINLGCGMDDEGICYVPALKNNTSNIEMINIRKKQNYPDYIFYTDSLLFNSEIECGFFNAWQFKIRKENNLCPECKKYEMEFIYVGEYD